MILPETLADQPVENRKIRRASNMKLTRDFCDDPVSSWSPPFLNINYAILILFSRNATLCYGPEDKKNYENFVLNGTV